MPIIEASPFHNPLERFGHTVKAIPPWAGRHWKSLSLATAALVGGGYLFITHDRGSQSPPIQPTVPASDTFNRPDSGLGIVIPEIATATPKPPETPASKIRPLTPETKVLSPQTTDFTRVTPEQSKTAFKENVDKNNTNKYPAPFELPQTAEISEYVLSNGIHGLKVEGLIVGQTYYVLAATDGRATGNPLESYPKDSPPPKTVSLTFYPNDAITTQRGRGQGFSFPRNAKIEPKFRDSNDSPWSEFKAGDILATYTVPPPDSPEQRDFESAFGFGVNSGVQMAYGIMSATGGPNKEPVSPSDVHLTDAQGRALVITPRGK